MKSNKNYLKALMAYLITANSYCLSLAASLRAQPGFKAAINYLLALGQWLFWYRLWIRQDEFHVSLDLNMYLLWSDDLILNYYVFDVTHRRQLAHIRNFSRTP